MNSKTPKWEKTLLIYKTINLDLLIMQITFPYNVAVSNKALNIHINRNASSPLFNTMNGKPKPSQALHKPELYLLYKCKKI